MRFLGLSKDKDKFTIIIINKNFYSKRDLYKLQLNCNKQTRIIFLITKILSKF